MSRDRLTLPLLFAVIIMTLLPCVAAAAGTVDVEITNFIKRFYSDNEIQVTFTQLPQALRDGTRVRSLSFSKVPDVAGDGICLVSIEGRSGLDTNVYVPFKVQVKRVLFSLKHNLKKGETVRVDDLSSKETFLQGAATPYPASAEEIVGRTVKKEIVTGEIIVKQMLEEQLVVAKGEIVNMILENKKLLVQAKGVALEKGKMGDVVRVRSVSGKEVLGKVTGSNSVSVEF
jgi:flagellar basal body P-ring formation protein FlgA